MQWNKVIYCKIIDHVHKGMGEKMNLYIPHFDLFIIRWIQYISGSIYVGMLFFYLCILPKGSLQSASIEERYRKIFNFAFVLLFLCILLNLPLQVAVQANRMWQDAWNFSVFKNVITSTAFGQVWLLQVTVILLLSFFSFRVFARKNNLYLWVAFILGIVLLALKAMNGYAYTAANRNLAITMDTLLLVTASIWLGGLVALVALLPLLKKKEGKIFFRGIVHLFFPWGVFSVLILETIGVYTRLLYVPTIYSLFHSDYGRVLTGKVLLLIFSFAALILAIKKR
jgi:copper transport protein